MDRFPASGMGELSYGILFSGFRHPTYKAGISAGTSGDHHQAARKRNHTGGCAWTTVVKVWTQGQVAWLDFSSRSLTSLSEKQMGKGMATSQVCT